MQMSTGTTFQDIPGLGWVMSAHRMEPGLEPATQDNTLTKSNKPKSNIYTIEESDDSVDSLIHTFQLPNHEDRSTGMTNQKARDVPENDDGSVNTSEENFDMEEETNKLEQWRKQISGYNGKNRQKGCELRKKKCAHKNNCTVVIQP